jgi:hypothetical protein
VHSAGTPITCVSGWWAFHACQKPVVADTAASVRPAKGPATAFPVRASHDDRVSTSTIRSPSAWKVSVRRPAFRLQTSAVVRSGVRKTTIGRPSRTSFSVRSRANPRGKKAAELFVPSSPTIQSARRGGPLPARTTRLIRAASSWKPRAASSGAT